MRFYLLHVLVVLHLTSQISAEFLNVLEQNVKIDLSDYGKNKTFTYKMYMAEGNVIIDIVNATEGGFFVIQAHSFQSNISLSKTDPSTLGYYVIGANIGMVEVDLDSKAVYRYYLKYIDKASIQVLLSVVLYGAEDPIPGGCNMVYNTKFAPYQVVSYDDYMIQVDAAPALDSSCNIAYPHLDMYHMYLPEGNSDINVYFNAIEKLMTVDGIKKYARKVSDSANYKSFRRYYSAYPGTGSLYAIIAISGNGNSAYVPAVTYACDVNNWDESCSGPVSVIWKVLCAMILFMGVFMCMFGHRFFRIALFIFGFVCGSFISYVSSPFAETPSAASLGFAVAFGFCYGCIWLFFWWRFGIPVLSVFVPVFFTGYIMGSVLFYTGLGDISVFESDLNYWGVFFGIIVIVMIILLFITEFANILSCSMIGATAVVIAIDHYIGGTIHYVIINNIRRATITNFQLAILDPPYQYKDIILGVTWLVLIILGVVVQRNQQVGKPPFPPHRAALGNMLEARPLLGNSRSNFYTEDRQTYS